MTMITPEELKAFRKESGLTGNQLAELINTALGMRYTNSSISKWENGQQDIPIYVQEAVEGLIAGVVPSMNGSDPTGTDGDDPVSDVGRAMPPPHLRRPDTPPPPPSGTTDLVRQVSMESMCIEMFVGIGQMVEFFGQVTGQPEVLEIGRENGRPVRISLLAMDGRIIAQDSEALGKAWAKLAQQNAWVGRIVGSLTMGGAWVEVIAATSGTMVKVFRTHAEYSQWIREQQRPTVPEPGHSDSAEE